MGIGGGHRNRRVSPVSPITRSTGMRVACRSVNGDGIVLARGNPTDINPKLHFTAVEGAITCCSPPAVLPMEALIAEAVIPNRFNSRFGVRLLSRSERTCQLQFERIVDAVCLQSCIDFFANWQEMSWRPAICIPQSPRCSWTFAKRKFIAALACLTRRHNSKADSVGSPAGCLCSRDPYSIYPSSSQIRINSLNP